MAGEKKTKQLSIRVHDSLYDTLENIADSERRKLSEISLALLERGIIAYKRDHKLFEYPSGRTAILRFPFEGPWPSEPGVFHILAKNNGSIFVGESENIAAEMKHLHSTEKHRLHKYHPEIIVVEYISNEEERKKRAERLIIESHPAAQFRPIRPMITYIETRTAPDGREIPVSSVAASTGHLTGREKLSPERQADQDKEKEEIKADALKRAKEKRAKGK